MGGMVVDDEMDVEVSRDIGLDVAQEGEEFLMTMARLALCKDRTIERKVLLSAGARSPGR